MNTQVTESASDLQDSTLPVMCINIEDNRVNRMYGYKEPMASIKAFAALAFATSSKAL